MPSKTHPLKQKLSRREYFYDEITYRIPSYLALIHRLITIFLLVIIGLFITSLDSYANASIEASQPVPVHIDKISEGSLLVKTATPGQYRQMPLQHTDVSMRVSGMIVRSHLKQRFKNNSNEWIEAMYVFPLPETAAVDHMRIHIGERIIEAKVKEKLAAKKTYEAAKRNGLKAALIEQERTNLFTNSVANIGPGETIIVEIEYQQVLHYEQGNFSLRFPMAITPRYIPGKPINEKLSLSSASWGRNTDQVPDADRITPPIVGRKQNPRSNKISINIQLNSGFPLKKLISRYHPIIKTEEDNIIQVSLDQTLDRETTLADRDFELEWSPQLNHAPKAAIFNEQIKGENYQLLMLLPPGNALDSKLTLAKNVTYIIDTSGSMFGASMEQAKNALLMALNRLNIHDEFNIIQFNSITDTLFSNPRFANSKNILSAKQYIHSLKANGGTEMAPALNLAFNQAVNKNTLHQVIFLTDGSVGNESALFELIHKRLGESRLFTIGIGSAPNSFFMRKVAQFGRGSFTYIGNVNEVNSKMTKLFKQLENPVMANIKIKFDDNIKAEMWPKRIPDLYLGQAIIVAIKSTNPINKIHLTGSRALTPWSASLTLDNTQSSKGIGTFWARNKIESLTDSLHDGANKEQVRSEIINVALTHHLVSQHTSLVAIDTTPARPVDKQLHKRAIPVNLPLGQSFGPLAQTATSAQLNLISGLTLLFLGLVLSLMLHLSQKARLLHISLFGQYK